jgi:hypothetical protein
MNSCRSRIAAGLAITIIATVMGASAADAAATSAPRNAVPRTVPAVCTPTAAWLKLRAATGEFCYTGNGTLVVDLPGVRAGQIAGRHRVCLYLSSRPSDCFSGPVTFRLIRPAYVRYVTITTPR